MPRSYADKFAKGITGKTEITVIPGAGHLAELDKPDEVAAAILGWSARHCEERSNEQSRADVAADRDCFAPLAMTAEREKRHADQARGLRQQVPMRALRAARRHPA